MQIYKITNTINNKCYIGQTVNSFHKRYFKHKWWTSKNINNYLKNSIKKYGPEVFLVEILKRDVSSEKILDELEIEYIKMYNCRYPNGYNFQEGGSKENLVKDKNYRSILSARSRRVNKTPFLELKNHKDGKIYTISHMGFFCKEHGLLESKICNVLSGKRKRHKFWTLPNTQLEHFVLISPSGEVYDIMEGELRPFCREKKLVRHHLKRAFKMGWSGHRGWKIESFYKA